MRVNHPPKAAKRSPSAEPRLTFILRHLDRKKAGHNQTAERGKGRSHNLPLAGRQAVVAFRFDATKLKKIRPDFAINVVR